MGWAGSTAGDLYPVFPKKWPGLTTQLLARRCALPQHPNGNPAALVPPCASSLRLLPPAPSPAPGCLYLQWSEPQQALWGLDMGLILLGTGLCLTMTLQAVLRV